MDPSPATDGIAPKPVVAAGPPAGSVGELLAYALPLVLSSGSLSLMNVIDRVFLTRYSPDALAASTPAGMLHWTVMSVVIGTASCVTTFVAQYEGAGRKERVAAAVWQGAWLSLVAGLLFAAVVPFSATIFDWAGHAPAVRRLEVEYFSTLCYGAVPMVLCSALSGFFSGRGRTRTVLAVNVGLAVMNVSLDTVLIFGAGPLPPLGIRGAAIATVTSYVMAATAYFLLMTRREERTTYAVWSSWRPDRALFARLLRYGLPTGFQHLADMLSFTLFLFLVGRLGPLHQQATNLAFNLNGLAFVPLMGLGTAVMSIVGRRVGEGRPELGVRTTWLAFALGGGWMLLFAGLYVALPDLAMAAYVADMPAAEAQRLRELVVILLRFVAVFGFFDGMVVVFSGAVRGAGDTRFPMVLLLLTGWLVMLLPVAVADHYGRNTLMFSWMMCSISIVVAGLGMAVRFLRGRWMSLKVIEREPTPPAAPPMSDAAGSPRETVGV